MTALDTWAVPARPLLPSAVKCASHKPADPLVLCEHLRGHQGLCGADLNDTWTDTEEAG